MSQDAATESPDSDVTSSMNFEDTELTLGLPGEGRSPAVTEGITKNCAKRGFIETVVLNLGSSHSSKSCDNYESRVSGTGKFPASKAQVIGWPPVRSFRKEALESRCSKLVKVAVDGAPYLRKVDLEMYSSYEELFMALEKMFSCSITLLGNLMEENSKLMGGVKRMEYMPTYEDKDDDWMLVGDVPWKMFMESCKRIRLKKSSEAIEFALRTPSNC